MIETEKKSSFPDLPEFFAKSDMKLLTLVILLSSLFGIAGAVFGSVFLLKTALPAGVMDIKSVKVTEDSAVVDTVKKSSPAVVSIIISKDLNKVPGFSTSPFSPFDSGPFSLDPFFQQRNPNSSQPNVQEVGGGSGFIISSDGLIVTNKHVVEDATATYTVLTNDGKKFDATILARDPANDLALVKIQADNLPVLPLGNSSDLQIGQKVIAIGNSLGHYRNTVTTGVVSGIGRSIIAGGSTGSESLDG